jgi:GT2 family glycosyltransferase
VARSEYAPSRPQADARAAAEAIADGLVLKKVNETRELVSVVVVCRNSARVLERCLQQLLAQDYPAYEIIVVDDDSEDQTLDVAEKALGSGRVTIVRSPLNRGCPGARNVGLRYVSGEIIAFIDADGFADRGWLSALVATFEGDESIGGVASTVFLAWNPVVLNGAGGVINRQGWAADLSMGESYESAEIQTEVLYPMGCGMAVRRVTVERVGPFDDRMFNYYDDVDYGIRIWRAGYRVVVAPDAWIDHAFNNARRPSAQKRLLCEQNRMRVVLKHYPLPRLVRWLFHEARAIRRAWSPDHELKLNAVAWNVRHLPSTLTSRIQLRGSQRPPGRLLDPSWGEAFPRNARLVTKPHPETAANVVDLASPESEDQLLYGWFPAENAAGRAHRWAGGQAALLVRLEQPAQRLRLEYSHVPGDVGGIDVCVRRSGSSDPLTPVWGTHLRWRYLDRVVENHPIALAPGLYDVVFRALKVWSNPPRESRTLGFALSRISFDEEFELVPGELDMASPVIEGQLVSGWYDPEYEGVRGYRWGGTRAAVMVRVTEDTTGVRLNYRPPPNGQGVVTMSLYSAHSPGYQLSSFELASDESSWRDLIVPVRLTAGDYMVKFDSEFAWTNPGQRDPRFPPENRSLAFGLSSLAFSPARKGPS